jgi:hypothetical protein
MVDKKTKEIVDLLMQYRHNKIRYERNKEGLRVEMLRIATENGLPNEEARVANLADYLDGYLHGIGIQLPYRKAENYGEDV